MSIPGPVYLPRMSRSRCNCSRIYPPRPKPAKAVSELVRRAGIAGSKVLWRQSLYMIDGSWAVLLRDVFPLIQPYSRLAIVRRAPAAAWRKAPARRNYGTARYAGAFVLRSLEKTG